MFGLVVANYDDLKDEDKEIYKAFYCGLCRTLNDRYGLSSRLTLTYDLTFLSIVLTSCNNKIESETGSKSCFVHPFKKREYIRNGYIEYAAAVNVLLAYYNLIDNWNDERSIISKVESALLKKAFKKASDAEPEISEIIRCRLEELNSIEKEGILNPDIPADCFGMMLGEIFVRGKNYENPLFDFGKKLGRLLYIADAICDLDSDIKHLRYNPLVNLLNSDPEGMLLVLLSDCSESYSQIEFRENKELMDNIIYSGIKNMIDIKRKLKKRGKGKDA